ncbi:MAG TPA: dipeptidase [Vicinamibacterales bacterium]|nr:dipeptidase [Vicinamibacterales bacterium]
MRSPALLSAASVAALSVAVLAAQAPDADLIRRARAIHERVITLDTHNDIEPENFTTARNYTQRLDTQVNLPKMVEGGLDASFFIVYVGQPDPKREPDALSPAGYDRAYKQAIAKFEAVHRLTEQIAPDRIGLALTADDVRRIAASGRKVALIGVENGYAIGEDLRRVQEFYDRGGRYLSLAHNGNNQLSDSNTGEREGYLWKNGISPMGERVIAEMNRLGMMVDVSHPSRGSMLRAVALSRAPVIASHSAVRALCDVPRNMDDEMLRALGKNDGVIQIVGLGDYLRKPLPDSPERAAALKGLRAEFGIPEPEPRQASGAAGSTRAMQEAIDALPPSRRTAYDARLADIGTRLPPDPPATVKDLVTHIDYVVKLIGIDHVGIASDFDGGGGLADWKDASETFNVTLELVRRGYSEAQISKIWSGNLLRVMEKAQAVAKQLQGAGR